MNISRPLILASLIGLSALIMSGGARAQDTHNAQQPEQPNVGEAIRSGDLPGAARRARELADANYIEGQYNLSLFYWHGVAIPQNYDEAVRWTTLAAVRGHTKAASARRVMAKTLEPIVIQKAMEWSRLRLTKMAEGGDDAALVSMARSFAPDFGFANDVEAYYWATLAVSAGRTEARRQRDALVVKIKQADLLKTQQKANDWFMKFRKDRM